MHGPTRWRCGRRHQGGGGGSSVYPSSICLHFVECIVSSGDNSDMLMKRREIDLQVHMVEGACSHVQSLMVSVLERANSFM